jgi:hypothetical protein
MDVTRASDGYVTRGAGDTDVTTGCACLAIVRRRFFRKVDRLAVYSFQHKFRVALGLHPRMAEEAVVICTMAALRVVDVRYGNEPMRGKLLNKPNHVTPGAM